MPEMIVSPDSSSTRARNVGSSFVNRCSAFPMFACAFLSFALMRR